jgi:hypothetical protein
MKLIPLNIETVAARKATHVCILTKDDLTQAADDTAQVIPIISVPANSIVRVEKVVLVTPFKDASDVAFNTTPLTIGDTGDADRLLTSTELNVNGTEVILKQGPVGATLAAVTTTDATTEATVYALANALKVAHNALIAQLNAGPDYVYAAATTINATFGSMSAKALEDIDVGEVHVYLYIVTV